MNFTISTLKDFLNLTSSYDVLPSDLIYDILGDTVAEEFQTKYQLSLNDDIPWNEIANYGNFNDFVMDDNFTALISAYFDIEVNID